MRNPGDGGGGGSSGSSGSNSNSNSNNNNTPQRKTRKPNRVSIKDIKMDNPYNSEYPIRITGCKFADTSKELYDTLEQYKPKQPDEVTLTLPNETLIQILASAKNFRNPHVT